MIFRRALLREFSQTAVTVFVALFAILLTTQLIRLLNQAAGGKLAPDAVIALLGFGAINYLPVLLSLTVFVAVLLTLSRWYRDSEMIIWFASGLPLTTWVWPVIRFALPLVVAIAVLSMFLSPWALTKSGEYRQDIDRYVSLRKRLGLTGKKLVMCVAGLSDEHAKGLTAMYDLTFVSEQGLLPHLRTLF